MTTPSHRLSTLHSSLLLFILIVVSQIGIFNSNAEFAPFQLSTTFQINPLYSSSQPTADTGFIYAPIVTWYAGAFSPTCDPVKNTLHYNYTNNTPVIFNLWNEAGPVHGTGTWSGILATMLSYVDRADYIISDFECTTNYPLSYEIDDIQGVVQIVRSNTNSSLNRAWIGNYNFDAASVDTATIFPWWSDRSQVSQGYLACGANMISMPVCYEYGGYIGHADAAHMTSYGFPVSPNGRSGMFYGALERFSQAARALPLGHKIVPWVGNFIASNYASYPWANNSTPPVTADRTAHISHFRLRGADFFYEFYAPNEGDNIGAAADRANCMNGWKADSMDTFFNSTKVKSILNLSTNKTLGLEWSGVRIGNNVKTLVSNMATTTLSATYPGGWGDLPANSAPVSPGTHQFFNYTINNLVYNGTFNTNANGWYYNASTGTYSSTGGTGNGPCLILHGTQGFSAVQTVNINTEANAAMTISAAAKCAVAGRFSVGYYYYNAAGTCLGAYSGGSGILDTGSSLTTTLQTFASSFTIVNNPSVKSIRLILYNSNAANTLYVDDIVVKFQ